jgi:large exoprotein involved in heme utilization and adhesion
MDYIMKVDRCLLMLVGVVGAIASFPFPVGAQLQPIADTAPDRSLGTTVEPLNVQTDLIRGGVRSANGVNLFHSFQEFNIGQGRGAYFLSVVMWQEKKIWAIMASRFPCSSHPSEGVCKFP